jgi:hypothetical protein
LYKVLGYRFPYTFSTRSVDDDVIELDDEDEQDECEKDDEKKTDEIDWDEEVDSYREDIKKRGRVSGEYTIFPSYDEELPEIKVHNDLLKALKSLRERNRIESWEFRFDFGRKGVDYYRPEISMTVKQLGFTEYEKSKKEKKEKGSDIHYRLVLENDSSNVYDIIKLEADTYDSSCSFRHYIYTSKNDKIDKEWAEILKHLPKQDKVRKGKRSDKE